MVTVDIGWPPLGIFKVNGWVRHYSWHQVAKAYTSTYTAHYRGRSQHACHCGEFRIHTSRREAQGFYLKARHTLGTFEAYLSSGKFELWYN